MLKLISPAGVEPASKKVIPAINSPAVAVDAKDFTESLPLLKEIETLILVGDGTGRGKLPYSGHEAESAELDLDNTAGAREARSARFEAGTVRERWESRLQPVFS